MREIYLWTDWFTELAKKIAADDGKVFLMERAGNVNNLSYGDLNVDPFSFVYNLAKQGSVPEKRNQVFPSVDEAFGMGTSIPVDCDDAFIFPPYAFTDTVEVFSSGLAGDSELLWHLFRAAVHQPENVEEHFNRVLEIDGVTMEQLTQALILINPSAFLPYDDATRSLYISNLQEVANWTQYQEALQRFRGAFPGCAFYEINLFSYLWKEYWKNREDRKKFHVSTNAYNDGRDFWKDTDPELDFEPNNWVFTGGAGPDRRPYPLCDPQPGDVMLVRIGISRGHGIGIVYRNDHLDQNHFDESRRIHVVWVNKKLGELAGSTEQLALNYAGNRTLNAFRQASAYKRTFALVGLSEAPMANQGTRQIPDVKHPLNQILYGPPGTGKTYHTVDHALAIIDPGSVSESRESKVERFREFQRSGRIAMVTFHQSYAYEDFIEGIRPALDDAAAGQIKYERSVGIFKQIAEAAEKERKEGNKERFVLVIDEINRGNIAKIFGELITLIEDSRRIGQKDATEVKLPYSNKLFGVPDNLYIIGTMNTADRSIQLLDTALRRRFAFVEMMPEPEHKDISTDVEGVDCQKMLKAMNKRIAALLDREHQIGHTYLMDVDTIEDLSNVFQNKIFPLLQEYFFDDWSKIRAVLGGNEFVSERDAPRLPADLEQGEGRKIYERLASDDKRERWKDPEQYRQIYTGDN